MMVSSFLTVVLDPTQGEATRQKTWRVLSPKGLAGVFATCFPIWSLHSTCSFLMFWHWAGLLLLLTQKSLPELVEVQSPVPAGFIKGYSMMVNAWEN